jgi:ABC-type siderophore export system fused ATPase/permease subunit
VGLHWINKRFGAKADFKSSAKILTASTLAAALSFLTTIVLRDPLTHLTTRTTFQALIQLAIGITIFLAAYVISAPLIGAVTQSDITTMRTLLAGLGPIAKIADIPLDAAEKILQIKNQQKPQNAHPP